MSLFLKFLKLKPVKASLVFGYNENIIVKSININPKLKDVILEVTLAQVDPTTKVVKAMFNGSFWGLDYTSSFVERNFTDMYSTLSGLLIAIEGDSSALLDKLDEIMSTVDDIKDAVSSKDNVKLIHQCIKDVMGELSTKDYSNILLKCKITANNKGFLEFGKEENWIVPMDGELPEITNIETDRYTKALAKPKETHAAPDNPDAGGSGEKKVAGGLGFGGSL